MWEQVEISTDEPVQTTRALVEKFAFKKRGQLFDLSALVGMDFPFLPQSRNPLFVAGKDELDPTECAGVKCISAANPTNFSR